MDRVQRRGFWNNLAYSLALLGLVVIALGVVTFLLQERQMAKMPVETLAQSRTTTDRLVESLQTRLKSWPQDQNTYVQLGGAYIQKARETGDPSYYSRAEAALLKALELNPNNASAMSSMSALALGQHQFSEAEQWARRSLTINAADPNTFGVLGDAQVELGQYDAAFESFQSMVDLKPNLNSYARVSYARELTGDLDGAIEVMKMAVAAGAPNTESTAWALVQLGNLYFNTGNLDAAAVQYEAALRNFNNYYLALAALGKVRAAQGQYNEAIQLYEQAVAIIPQPTTLAALGDLYARTGRPDQAKLQYDTVEFIGKLSSFNQQLYNRELALFYADHNIKLAEALKLTTQEIKVRQDIYGYDALAWALFKNGRLDKAAEAIAAAMKLGTMDASIYYHAGMIYDRLGDQQARQYLQQALKLNPHFSIQQADEAKRTLEKLGIRLMPADIRGGATP